MELVGVHYSTRPGGGPATRDRIPTSCGRIDIDLHPALELKVRSEYLRAAALRLAVLVACKEVKVQVRRAIADPRAVLRMLRQTGLSPCSRGSPFPDQGRVKPRDRQAETLRDESLTLLHAPELESCQVT
jgi:hypothetical protein